MHVFQWLIAGMIAGLTARLALRASGIGLTGDVALGGLSGLLAGALVRYAGYVEPQPGAIQFVTSMVGAFGVIALVHAFARFTSRAGRYLGVTPGTNGLEGLLAGLSNFERGILEEFLRRKPIARDIQREREESESFGQRTADAVARFGGSWAFIGLFVAALLAWVLFNMEVHQPFDPFPFILLNLILSCVAAIQAPIILMSQNRQAEKDRIHARADYEVNLKAELEILALHSKVDDMRDKILQDLIEEQRRQLRLLDQMSARLERQVKGAQ